MISFGEITKIAEKRFCGLLVLRPTPGAQSSMKKYWLYKTGKRNGPFRGGILSIRLGVLAEWEKPMITHANVNRCSSVDNGGRAQKSVNVKHRKMNGQRVGRKEGRATSREAEFQTAGISSRWRCRKIWAEESTVQRGDQGKKPKPTVGNSSLKKEGIVQFRINVLKDWKP